MLETEDAKLRDCEQEYLDQKKKQLFPNGINLGVFSECASEDKYSGSGKSRESSAEQKRECAKTFFNDLSDVLA